jgi:hypothetical protein
VKLVPIDDLIPASYNPRRVDPERLALVELSIRKLGWLLPCYATASGELLSGHQRTHVARDLGYTHVPVVQLPEMEDRTRKAVNILFNRSTNDMDVSDIPQDLKEELTAADPQKMAAKLKDRPNYYPCLKFKTQPIAPFLKANARRWIPYARNVARSLKGYGIVMPIIVGPGDQVLNGIGRLQMLAEKGQTTADFIHLNRRDAKFAHVMLNLLSMDFNVEEHYADLLRYNSFRRARRTRKDLGRGFIWKVVDPTHTKNFDWRNAKEASRWCRVHGRSVVDFGAGHLTETEILRSMGVKVTPFEPYRLGLGTGRWAGDWFRDPADYSVIFSATSNLPIRDEDDYVVVLHSELDALKKRARDLIMDHRFSRGGGRELNQREINARCQLQSISKPNFKVEVKRRWKLRARK